MSTAPLFVSRGRAPAMPPADRGPIRTARELAALVFDGRVSAKWVLARVAPEKRFRYGREVCWYEADAREWKAWWIAEQQQQNADGDA